MFKNYKILGLVLVAGLFSACSTKNVETCGCDHSNGDLTHIAGDCKSAPKMMEHKAMDKKKMMHKEHTSPIMDSKKNVMDSDNDGIIDSADFCPRTMSGSKVDAEGCVIRDMNSIDMDTSVTAHFDIDKSNIKAAMKKEIEEYAVYLNKFPNSKIVVEGHTDSTASEQYNESLAARRAIAVKDMLVDAGIDSNRIRVESYGETQPVIDNATAAHRAQNRRAISKIIR